MSQASRRTGSGTRDRSERLRSRVAVFVTALVHLLLVLLAIWLPPITMTTQGGDAGGGSLDVTFIDESLRPPPPARPPARPSPPRKHVKAAPKAERLQTTLVMRSEDPVPAETSEPPNEPEAPVAPDETPPQPPHVWGQPPGMLPQDVARANPGPTRGAASARGQGAASAGASMEVDGYQVYYDLVRETRLREWRDQGMTELFLPLPGTRRLMVCPLELVLRRDSGECRMVEPDAPELKTIGDARDVISMQRVYKLGEVLWSGPGPYR